MASHPPILSRLTTAHAAMLKMTTPAAEMYGSGRSPNICASPGPLLPKPFCSAKELADAMKLFRIFDSSFADDGSED